MKFTIVAAYVLLALFIYACNPYEFNMGRQHIMVCKVLTSLPSVEQGHTIATLHDTGAINMNYFGATQYLITMDVRLNRGEGFRILLRPDVEQRDVKDSGIVLTVTRNGVWMDTVRQTFLKRLDVRLQPNEVLPISLLSENHYTQIVLGCDTIYKGWSKRMESDNVVVQALEGSEVEVIAPDWAGLPDR